MNISIFGLGYVGCVSLGCLAKNGCQVVGVDLNKTKVDFINKGQPTIEEDEIGEIISDQHQSGSISATTNGCHAVKNTEISFVCVGTPSSPNGHLNLYAVFTVAKEIGKALKEKDTFHIIAIRSTVLPGTNEKVSEIIQKVSGKKCNKNFAVVSNPEFLREGSSVKDYFNPPFTLVGATNDKAIKKIKKIYSKIRSPFIVTDIKTAEVIKYVNNAFHALKITFANEIGNICKKLNINSHEVMDIFCLDKKLNLSPYYLKPGFAYGGSCLPKDLKALKTIAHDLYLSCPVLESIERSNELHIARVLDNIINFKKEKVGFLGISFKAGTDDLRNSPILEIIEVLLGKGFDVKIYDKNVHFAKLTGANREYILNKIPFVSKFIGENPIEVIEKSDLVIVVNKEKEFSSLLENAAQNKIIYDLANIELKNKNKLKNYFGINW